MKPSTMSRRNPASSASSGPAPPSGSAGATAGREGCTPDISRADQAKVAALKRSTTGTLVVASNSPAIAGPTKNERLSSVLLVPLAAVSSSGRVTREGVKARRAGRNGVPTTDAVPASTNTRITASLHTQTAAEVMSTIRTRSEVMRIRFRSCRSAKVEVNGVTTAISSSRITAQTATSLAPPTPYAQTATAVA